VTARERWLDENLTMAKKPSPKPASASPDAASKPEGVAAVMALIGPELFLHTQHTARIKAALQAQHGEFDTVRFEGESAEVGAVLDECRTFGLMIQHKLVIVETADKFINASSRAALERYVAEPASGATMVLRSQAGWVPGKLGEAIEARGGVMKCEAPKEAELAPFIAERAAGVYGVKIEPEAAALLVDRLGVDLARIDGELAKLAAGLPKAEANTPAKDRPTITLKHARAMVGLSREDVVWDVQGELVSGSTERALRSVREMLEVSRHPPTLVSFACVDLARKLAIVSKAQASGMNPFQAAGKAKIWGHSRDAVLAAAKRAGPRGSAALLRDAVEADAAQKTGRGDPQRTLERLALRFGAV
jgi:DNA polymerase III subunit delta